MELATGIVGASPPGFDRSNPVIAVGGEGEQTVARSAGAAWCVRTSVSDWRKVTSHRGEPLHQAAGETVRNPCGPGIQRGLR